MTEWWLGGPARWIAFISVALGGVTGLRGIVGLIVERPFDFMFVVEAIASLFVPLALLLLIITIRTRTIRWSDVRDIHLNRDTNYGTIQCTVAGAGSVALPAPRAMGADVMSAAIESLEYRRLLAQ